MNKKLDPHLKVPEGVAPTGMVVDLDTAFKQAIVSIPVLLAGKGIQEIDGFEPLLDSVSSIASSLEVIGEYFRRKGHDENIFLPNELDETLIYEEGQDNEPDKVS